MKSLKFTIEQLNELTDNEKLLKALEYIYEGGE